MKTEPAGIGAASCLFLLALVLSGSRAAISQTGPGRSTEKLPPVIARALDTVPFSFVYDGLPANSCRDGKKRRGRKRSPATGSAAL
jgi:hypothetical protein